MNTRNTGPELFRDLLSKKTTKKPPAHQWQDLALRVIDELRIPTGKRNSVFGVCKKFPKPIIEKALNDTKELCHDGETYRYFFKILSNLK